jgi:RHS repeat-associated protein
LDIAVNPVTNKVYVADYFNGVTVVDGTTNSSIGIATSTGTKSVAVNPVANKIYVTNNASNTVTVIDGATNSTTTVATNPGPTSVAVDSYTNKIYVTNIGNTVTVIDGATNTTTTVVVGNNNAPVLFGNFLKSVAINPVTHKVYVANYSDNTVSVIDGFNNSNVFTVVTDMFSTGPNAVAVNSTTNKIYVANRTNINVTVIDGATNIPSTVQVDVSPNNISINEITNKIYLTHPDLNVVTVIDGATNATSTVQTGASPVAIVANPNNNQIYVANYYGNTVTVIDGATNTTATVAVGLAPRALGLNPVTNKVYVANYSSNTVTVINGAITTIPLSANAADTDGSISKVEFYKGSTLLATDTTAPYSFSWGNMASGSYVLTAKAYDNQNAVTISAPVTVNVTALPTVSLTAPANNSTFSAPASITLAATAADSDGTIAKVEFYDNGALLGTSTAAPYSYIWNLPPVGVHQITAKATDNVGAATTSAAVNISVNSTVPGVPVNVTAAGGNVSATVTFTAPASNGGSTITGYTVTSSPAGGVDSNANTTGLSHIITGLTNGTYYTFTVTATNAVGTGAASAASNSVTPAPVVPDAPAIGAATPGNSQATVTFTAPASNGGSPITGYTATSNPDGITGTCAASPCTVAGLANGTPYTFTVTATNAAGTSVASASSNGVTPMPVVPDAPTGVTAAGGNAQATVTFAAPSDGGSAITSYTVTSNPGNLTGTCAASPCTVTNLTNGTPYTFTVTAANAVGTGAASIPSNSVIPAPVLHVYYIHTDHLDTPRVITDTAGNKVWQWDNTDPFGNNVPNENPNGQGAFNFNLRFPGQYFDKETNTHYNYFRDYVPARGGYLQFDPIGLRGGINGYAYALSNPLRYTDMLGLEPDQICVAACTLGGAIAGGVIGEVGGGVIGGVIGGAGGSLVAPGAGTIGGAAAGAAAGSQAGGAAGAAGGAAAGNAAGKAMCPDNNSRCDQEWREARQTCRNLIYEQLQQRAGRRKKRSVTGVTGGYTDVEECARGLVSEECGGNRVDR